MSCPGKIYWEEEELHWKTSEALMASPSPSSSKRGILMNFEKPEETSRFIALLLGPPSSITSIVAHTNLMCDCVLKVSHFPQRLTGLTLTMPF